MDSVFNCWSSNSLVWLSERGMGFYPVDSAAHPYNEAYFRQYERWAATDLGRALTAARIAFVARHYTGPLVDVGIGSGQFVETRGGDTYGYDVNELGVCWLVERGLFVDPRASVVRAATFWDSLEHIMNPSSALELVTEWVFVSMPIYKDGAHVLRSKHFKRNEHRWYWTKVGFIAWAEQNGFVLVEHNRTETDLGREDIESFAFRRAD